MTKLGQICYHANKGTGEVMFIGLSDLTIHEAQMIDIVQFWLDNQFLSKEPEAMVARPRVVTVKFENDKFVATLANNGPDKDKTEDYSPVGNNWIGFNEPTMIRMVRHWLSKHILNPHVPTPEIACVKRDPTSGGHSPEAFLIEIRGHFPGVQAAA